MLLPLVVLLIMMFVVIIGFLHFFFGRQLKIALGRLQVLHQESLEKEAVLNKEIERARAQSQTQINRSADEAKLILENARQQSEKIIFDAQERAAAEAKKIVNDGAARLNRLETEAASVFRQRAVALACELIQYVFTQKGAQALQLQFVDEFIEKLDNLERDKLPPDPGAVQLMTAQPIDRESRERLRQVLFAKFGVDIPMEEKIDDSLILGLVVQMGGLLIDASLKNRLGRAAEELRAADDQNK